MLSIETMSVDNHNKVKSYTILIEDNKNKAIAVQIYSIRRKLFAIESSMD